MSLPGVTASHETHGLLEPDRSPVHPMITLLFFFCVCVYPLGGQSMYDAPAAMGNAFRVQYDMSESEYGLLYAMYGLPNVALTFFVGFLCDKLGPNWSGTLFAGIIVVGGTVVCFSGDDYGVLLAGFSFFGLGAGAVLVPQAASLSKWFKGDKLAIAFALSTSVFRVTNFIDYNVDVRLVEAYGVRTALLYPWCLSLVAFGLSWASFALDRYRFRRKEGPVTPQGQWPSVRNVFELRCSFWLLVMLICSCSLSEFLFEMFAVGNYENQGMDPVAAASAVSVAPFVIMFTSPLAALFSDKYGYAVHIIGLGVTLQILASALWVLDSGFSISSSGSPAFAYLTAGVFGAGYALCVGLIWPSVALVVPDRVIGTSYAILSSSVSLGIFVLPPVVASLPSTLAQKLAITNLCMASLLVTLILLAVDAALPILRYPHGKVPPSTPSTPRSTSSRSAAECDLDSR